MKFDIQEELKKLPDCPGVYIHKDKTGQIIYVGKAISLRKRVRQYFQHPKNMPAKVRKMVEHIEKFEYVTCDSEVDALILECRLIKRYHPKYNILLRDDKSYPYINVSVQDDFPTIVKTRRLLKDGARYFGPYPFVSILDMVIELLNSTYKLKRCSRTEFPRGMKACLNHHIGRCDGMCLLAKDSEEYKALKADYDR
ncbi:MAG: GIY-YIG nuclease family protein, partial [Firmicutes bacterium]|nr:GIY-YIG nuclease family protein [Bacillota bacterium]